MPKINPSDQIIDLINHFYALVSISFTIIGIIIPIFAYFKFDDLKKKQKEEAEKIRKELSELKVLKDELEKTKKEIYRIEGNSYSINAEAAYKSQQFANAAFNSAMSIFAFIRFESHEMVDMQLNNIYQALKELKKEDAPQVEEILENVFDEVKEFKKGKFNDLKLLNNAKKEFENAKNR